jgi:geranylgeranyl diphosphate synthase type II
MDKPKSIVELQRLFQQEIIATSFANDPKELYAPIDYFLNLGGKRLRPILVLLSADIYGFDLQRAMPQAMAIELFHNFTLVHDDIMDEAPLRRGLQTIHEKWDSNIGILSGDALFVKAYESIVQVDFAYLPSLMKVFNTTALQVCEGQQYDMNFQNKEDVSMASYIKMIKYKTGVLLACSLQVGALISGASKQDQAHLYSFGLHLGIAFQLMDDILDVYARQKDFGKQIAGDILSNKKTCLYIKARELAKANHRVVLDIYFSSKNFDSKEKIEKVMEVYAVLQVKKYCLEMMDYHHQIALNHLGLLQVSEERKSSLKEFSELLMIRQN